MDSGARRIESPKKRRP